ncbi:phosphoribosylaminoimidazole-succinocarboxamide synthase [Planctomycetia bacterium]|nr:phosphoribosylaminoimidazole-succinocarboxamide synthase [Planctomycetia bacterium]
MSQSSTAPLITTDLPLGTPMRGKVRDCYRFASERFGDALLIVSTDRVSAFDWILPTPIPDKGRVLTTISVAWFDLLARGPRPVAHHLLTADVDEMGLPSEVNREPLRGRTMLVRRAEVIPFECVVRGWLAGSGLAEYRAGGTVCGVPLPAGLGPGDRLPEPIFTPATKAATGHDENVSFETMTARIGLDLATELRAQSLDVYARGAAHAAPRGIVVADTKFEWGRAADGSLLLVDEVLTPDSSRFWPAAAAGHGSVPESFDKQFIRDWLETSGWDKASPPPALPADVVARTRDKYLEACRLLTGRLPDGVAAAKAGSKSGLGAGRTAN